MARAMAVMVVMLMMCVVAASAARPAPGRVLAEVPSSAPTPSFDGIPDSPAPIDMSLFRWAPDSAPEGAPVESLVVAPPSWAPVWEPVPAPESDGSVGADTYYAAP